MKRFVAGLIAAILLVSCVAFLDGGSNGGRRTDGLYYKASGIHPDATIMTINGEKISAEEYLYWLAYDCEYLSSYGGNINWNDTVSDNVTYADYVMDEVTDTMRTYAVVRQMAKKGDITLNDEDMTALDAQRQQYIDYYGGEEGYQQQIQLLGISEEAFDQVNSMYYLYARVQETFDNGALRPTDDELQAFAKDNGLVSAKLLFLSTEDMGEDEIQQRHDLAQSYADKLKKAKDIDKTYAKFAEELGLEGAENGQTFSADDAGEKLIAAVSKLDNGAVSDVVKVDGGFYVAVRMPLDLTAVADRMFTQTIESAIESADVKYNDAVYNKVDVNTFYTNLLQAQQELSNSFGKAADKNSVN